MPPTPLKAEPIAGYTVTERLGAGGYGEVWKAEAPGGLTKAIKFIYGYLSDEKASREQKALNRIKQLRHPFLLSLERIEVIDGQLVIVTELADMSLKDRFQACREAGQEAIPRGELLGYLRDAADALDYLTENALQHLDVKPENLLIVGGRIKVADFGLVKDIQERTVSMMGGMTPLYASPEVFDGRPSTHSDQYSLAIVYQEMLTGVLPFPGNSAAQLAAQHLHARPRLEALPEIDRPIIARALSKNPTARFGSCREMADALLAAGVAPAVRNIGVPWTEQGSKAHGEAASHDSDTPSPLRRGHSPRPADRRPPSRHEASDQRQAGRLSDSHTKTAPPAQRPVIEDLPPLELKPDEMGLRPTLFLGIGGTAGCVLRRLRRRLNDRFGSIAKVPILEMLLVDTDCKALGQAARDNRRGLDPAETLAMPLRKPQEYRTESLDILQWLSRRWLYNIPRSLQTEGLRPLGRLALVDHAPALFDRLREALARITSAESIATVQKSNGLQLRSKTPRVFIVSSVSGGTGSGMVLDVAFAVRMILADLNLSDEDVCGILTHSTNRKPSEADLATANAYACLTELYHYSRLSYPGDAAFGLPAFDREHSTFPNAYFVHLGDHLNEADFLAATDTLAEYLYLDAATAGGAFFDKCRGDKDEADGEAGVRLRTLGVCQFGCSQSNIPSATAEALCRSVLDRWCGEGRPSAAADQENSLETIVGSLIDKITAELHLNADHLTRQFRDNIDVQLRVPPDQFVDEVAAQVLTELDEGDNVPHDVRMRRIAAAVNQLLGLIEKDQEADRKPLVNLREGLEKSLHGRVQELGAYLARYIKQLADIPETRIPGAQRACERFGHLLRSLETAISESQERLGEDLARWHTTAAEPSSGSRWRPFGRQVAKGAGSPHDRVMQFCRLRFAQEAAAAALRMVRSVSHHVNVLNEQLVLVRRELGQLARHFDTPAPWSIKKKTATEQPGEENYVQAAVLKELESRFTRLSAQFEDHLQQTVIGPKGGLIHSLTAAGEELQRLRNKLRSEAHNVVLQAFKEIDLARLVLQPRNDRDGAPDNLQECIQSAWPRMLECGGAKRLLLVVPEGASASDLPPILGPDRPEKPTIVFDRDCDMVACYEAEKLPLAGVAASLTYTNPHCAEVAHRLHTRVDIEWSTLN